MTTTHLKELKLDVDTKFIEKVYAFYDEGESEYERCIDLEYVAVFLRKSVKYLVKKIKKLLDIKMIKSTKIKRETGASGKQYLISYIGLKLLIMCLTRTEESKKMIKYFLEIERVLLKYRYDILIDLFAATGRINRSTSEKEYMKMLHNKESIVYFLKETTNIDADFIDKFYSFYDDNMSEFDYVIDLDAIAGWLDTKKQKLTKKLEDQFELNEDYVVKENIDIKHGGSNIIKYYVNFNTFKILTATSEKTNGIKARYYFIEIEKTFIRYENLVLKYLKESERINKNNETIMKKYKGKNVIYVLKVNRNHEIYKVGKTTDIVKRIATYNVGKIDQYEIVYVIETNNIKKVEKCVKKQMKSNAYLKRSDEIFQVDLKIIQDTIKNCVNKKDIIRENKELLAQMGGSNRNVIEDNDGYLFVFDKSEYSSIRRQNLLDFYDYYMEGIFNDETFDYDIGFGDVDSSALESEMSPNKIEKYNKIKTIRKRLNAIKKNERKNRMNREIYIMRGGCNMSCAEIAQKNKKEDRETKEKVELIMTLELELMEWDMIDSDSD